MAVKNKKEGLTVDKIYKTILLVITAAFIITLVLVLFQPFGYHNLDGLKENLNHHLYDGFTASSENVSKYPQYFKEIH